MAYFEVVAGSYEEFLLGYKFSLLDSSLKQSFASHDHSSSLRCVAVSGNYMASGAADDRIIIYDLKTRKEHCMLTQHDATINCLQFTANNSHIISGSADGVISIVRVGNWKLEKMWNKGHKGQAILDLAVHSSGKLALSLGADCTLSTWNLVKGRQAFIVNLLNKCKEPRSVEKILWADDEVRFVLYGGRYTEIWSVETGGPLKAVEHKIRVTSCIWYSNDEILVGHEDGDISLVKISNLTRKNYKAHSGRVKSIIKCTEYIITASSDGEIKVWNRDMEELANVSTGCRITCLSVIPLTTIKKEEEIDEESTVVVEDSPKKVISKSKVIVELDESSGDEKEHYVSTKKAKKKHEGEFKNEESQNINGEIKKKKKKRMIADVEQNNASHFETSVEEITPKKKKRKKSKNLVDKEEVTEIEETISTMQEDSISEESVPKKKKKKKKAIEEEEQSGLKKQKKKKIRDEVEIDNEEPETLDVVRTKKKKIRDEVEINNEESETLDVVKSKKKKKSKTNL